MKLEEGMYVRTNEGIFRISHINISFDDNDFRKILLTNNEKVNFTSVEYIRTLKSQPSFNIIDLIEEGDYVNGERVIKHFTTWLALGIAIVKEQDIKSIVTKEQFESMSYKVGD